MLYILSFIIPFLSLIFGSVIDGTLSTSFASEI